MQRTEIHEVAYGSAVTETAAKPEKPKKSKKAREKTGKGGRKRLAEKAAIGSTPPPAGDSRPLWDLSPAELRAAVDRALWPADSATIWTPQPAISLSDYVRHGS